MTSRVSSARIVGREHELAELQAAYTDAVAGRPSLAFVAGESGVGKSRLLSEAERRMQAAGARVLWGDCFDLGEGELPYAPLVAALRPLARSGDPALDALDADLREELTAFLPGLSGVAGTSQGRLFEALLALLDAMAASGPLVLVVEDLHWADRSTRAFLTFLSRSICRQRLLVVASYRPDELHRRHPLRPVLAELEREPRARRVELRTLTEAELTEQLTDILGAPPQRDLVRRLWLRSEGNPLFTEELLAVGLDGRGGLPPTLREALMVRIERLPAAAQDVVRLLAAGKRLSHDVLADAGELEPRELRDALREAVASHILVADADGFYAFRHALLREVVHDDLLPGEQEHLHLALARALEKRADRREENAGAHLTAGIAHHYLAGGNQPAALTASLRAAGAAEAVHAYGEAAALLERALGLWQRVPDAADLAGVDEVGLLHRTARDLSAYQEHARAAALLTRALGMTDADADPERTAGLLETLARAQWALNHQDDALATAQRALDLLPPGAPSRTRADVLAWWARSLMLMGRYNRSVVVGEDGLAEARASGDLASEARASNALGVSLMRLGQTERGFAALQASIDLARHADRPVELHAAYLNLADGLHLVGRSDEAIAIVRRGLEELETGSDRQTWLRLELAEILIETGRLDEAATLLPLLERRPVGTTLLFHELTHAVLQQHRGDLTAVRQHLENVGVQAQNTVEPQFIVPYAELLAEVELHDGALAGARTAVAEALDRIVTCTDDAARVARVAAAGVHVEASAALQARDRGDTEALRTAVAQAETLARYVAGAAGRPVEDALLATVRAELAGAQGDESPSAWERAAASWDALGRPLVAGRARLRAAEAHVSAGDRATAAALVGAVRVDAAKRGAGLLLADADGLAARARLKLEGRDAEPAAAATTSDDSGTLGVVVVDDPFGLTPRELQVLGLVAEGATNRQVGEQLFMAEKTASVHVSRILAKLDVRSRTQAAAVAHRLGLPG